MVLLIILALATLSIAVDTLRFGISPMPSSKKILPELVARVKGKVVYELGSGWGGIAAQLSKENTVKAFEMAWVPWFFCCLRKYVGQHHFELNRKSFFSEDLGKADVIYCYLYPKAMEHLSKKFDRELKSGTVVFSNSFQILGKNPDAIIKIDDWMGSCLYCYHY